MQADYKLLVEYKKMVEQVSSVYGERTKDSMHSFIDTTLVGETKKWKKIGNQKEKIGKPRGRETTRGNVEGGHHFSNSKQRI